jgi:hypothetical protein
MQKGTTGESSDSDATLRLTAGTLETVISLELARRLVAAGVEWSPTKGDRFVLPDRNMDADVFVISEMVVQVREFPAGRVLAFNGTTEWALDSVEASEGVWMPREAQLRELLGDAFVSLERISVGAAGDTAGYAVTVSVRGREERHVDVDSECAYARALLSLLAS